MVISEVDRSYRASRSSPGIPGAGGDPGVRDKEAVLGPCSSLQTVNLIHIHLHY